MAATDCLSFKMNLQQEINKNENQLFFEKYKLLDLKIKNIEKSLQRARANFTHNLFTLSVALKYKSKTFQISNLVRIIDPSNEYEKFRNHIWSINNKIPFSNLADIENFDLQSFDGYFYRLSYPFYPYYDFNSLRNELTQLKFTNIQLEFVKNNDPMILYARKKHSLFAKQEELKAMQSHYSNIISKFQK